MLRPNWLKRAFSTWKWLYAVSCAVCLYSSINSATNEERMKKPGSENAGYENDANSSPMATFRFVICQEKPFNEKTTDSHSRRTGKWKVGTKRNLNPSPISSLISNSLLCSHFSISRFPWLVSRFPFHVLVTFGADRSRELKNRCRYFKETTSSITERWSCSRVPAVAPVLDRFSSIFVCYLAAVGLKPICGDRSRLFTVPYFPVRSSRSGALRYGLPSCMMNVRYINECTVYSYHEGCFGYYEFGTGKLLFGVH